ncbi:MAG: hypothetical protein MPJ05_01510 [Nitrosopumilus sp.]|nr:hypothetical protein [Nitrosopumilus sp.]
MARVHGSLDVDEIIRRFESNAIPLAEYTMMRDGRGLYCLFQDGRCLYVGRSRAVQSRVDDHMCGNGGNAALSRHMSRHGDKIYVSFVYLDRPDSELDGMRDKLARRLQPKFNRAALRARRG